MLVAKGDEINTVWFEDRPLRGYGHFNFDAITGRAAWEKLFGADKPNSILSGQGRSLVFETGHFQARADGTYASKIKLIGDQVNQDVITGQWKKSALLIDSTSDPDDNSNSLVEGLAGLLVVGGGLALYQKIRANRVAEAAQDAVDDAGKAVEIAQDELGQARTAVEEAQIEATAKQDALTLARDQLQQSKESEEAFYNQFKEIEKEIDEEEENLLKIYSRNQVDRFIDNPAKYPLPNDDGDDYLRLVSEQEEAIGNYGKQGEYTQQLESAVKDLESAYMEAEANIEAAQATLTKNLDALRDEKNILQLREKYQELADEDAMQSLDDIAYNRNPFDSDSFRANRGLVESGDVNEVKLMDQMIVEEFDEYKAQQIEVLKRVWGDAFTKSMEEDLGNIISEGSGKAYSSFVEATCSVPPLATGAKGRTLLGGGICTNIKEIDPIVDLYAEEFTIEENMIFKGSHVFDELRTNLADIGYEAEVGELVEFVAGPEFAGEAGELIGAFTEGTLAADEAVGALDIASIGLGGEAFVDGMALEVGGDALLGEIALDILEIAVIF
jgi:hypothetical protein